MLATASIGFPSSEALAKVQTELASLHVDVESFEWTPIVEKELPRRKKDNIKLVYVMHEWNRYGRWSGFSEAAASLTLTPDIGPKLRILSVADIETNEQPVIGARVIIIDI
jgi:hypothetical protein